jgi:VIT1/CCC1 family predicted Fe2+/Mn2+ transporter
MEQERYEIEHHRSQEREELKVLYAAKGFEEPLLDQVIDVMMADGDRLLKVMLQEELGLTLEGYQHPLKQGLGAGIGALASSVICLAALAWLPQYGIVAVALLIMGVAALLGARYEDNRMIPAFIWNVGIGSLCFGVVYFALSLFGFS